MHDKPAAKTHLEKFIVIFVSVFIFFLVKKKILHVTHNATIHVDESASDCPVFGRVKRKGLQEGHAFIRTIKLDNPNFELGLQNNTGDIEM